MSDSHSITKETGTGPAMILYTIGYRDSVTDKRLSPEDFYSSLPSEAIVVDIRSHAYSPFAPAYTGQGVASAVAQYKSGIKTFVHLRELGNTHRDPSGKRVSPPHFVDPEKGFARLIALLEEHRRVTIFCACSFRTFTSSSHRCHRFYVAEEIVRRLAGVSVVHYEQKDAE